MFEGVVLVTLFFIWLWYRSRRAELRVISSMLEAAVIPGYSHSLLRLRNELSRGRRHNRPLSLVVIRPNGAFVHNRSNAEGSNKSINHPRHLKRFGLFEFLLCGPILRDTVREIDITTYDGENNQFIIVLPETTKLQAVKTVSRFINVVGKGIADQLLIGVSEFPGAGLVIEDLVEHAMAECIQKLTEETEPNPKSLSLKLVALQPNREY